MSEMNTVNSSERDFLVKTLVEYLSRDVSEILHVPVKVTYINWRGVGIDAELGFWFFRSNTWDRILELGDKYGLDVTFEAEAKENGLVVHFDFGITPVFPEKMRWRRLWWRTRE